MICRAEKYGLKVHYIPKEVDRMKTILAIAGLIWVLSHGIPIYEGEQIRSALNKILMNIISLTGKIML